MNEKTKIFEQLNKNLKVLGMSTKLSRYNWLKNQLGRRFKSLDEITYEECLQAKNDSITIATNRLNCKWGNLKRGTLNKRKK